MLSAAVDPIDEPRSVESGHEPGAVPAWGYPAESRIPSRREESELVRRAQRGDSQAMERLIRANIRLVSSVVRRYRCRSFAPEDLLQEGIVGLILAIRRFDPERGCRLSTYALHWIRQAISRAAEQRDRLIHVPVQVSAELRYLRKLSDERQQDLGREPSDAELADAAGIAEARIQHLMGTVPDPLSLEALIGAEQDSPLLEVAEDPHASNPEMSALRALYHQDLLRLLSLLRPRERRVVEARYGLFGSAPSTLDELSRRLQISREGIRQIEARAIRKLRTALEPCRWE